MRKKRVGGGGGRGVVGREPNEGQRTRDMEEKWRKGMKEDRGEIRQEVDVIKKDGGWWGGCTGSGRPACCTSLHTED